MCCPLPLPLLLLLLVLMTCLRFLLLLRVLLLPACWLWFPWALTCAWTWLVLWWLLSAIRHCQYTLRPWSGNVLGAVLRSTALLCLGLPHLWPLLLVWLLSRAAIIPTHPASLINVHRLVIQPISIPWFPMLCLNSPLLLCVLRCLLLGRPMMVLYTFRLLLVLLVVWCPDAILKLLLLLLVLLLLLPVLQL